VDLAGPAGHLPGPGARQLTGGGQPGLNAAERDEGLAAGGRVKLAAAGEFR
jgi:hypothetical protein